MRRVRQKHTGPELSVRRALHAAGGRFRLHRRDLPGSPDIVMPKRRIAIFVHGCFWHRHRGCKKASMPKTRIDFWQEKFLRNVERDHENGLKLAQLGWHVVTIWECESKDAARLASIVSELLHSKAIDGLG
jgi:DNA mismatch endonuclease (patch repair protein)